MHLRELAEGYYIGQNKNCAEAMLLAANDYYHLGLPEGSGALLRGFGGGIGCGRLCGCLAGAVAALGALYGGDEGFRGICSGFVAAFEEKLACGSTECAVLAANYKKEDVRCLHTVLLAADAMEAFVEEQGR